MLTVCAGNVNTALPADTVIAVGLTPNILVNGSITDDVVIALLDKVIEVLPADNVPDTCVYPIVQATGLPPEK